MGFSERGREVLGVRVRVLSRVELALSVLSCPVLQGVLGLAMDGSESCVVVDGICTGRSPSGVHECRHASKQSKI